ncbi:MAG: hypothetical protein FD166_315 [Bacteroidetes bacterium]|nr:MAG: hypothetical protein FD166_315 [Bacteroidota bacterium]
MLGLNIKQSAFLKIQSDFLIYRIRIHCFLYRKNTRFLAALLQLVHEQSIEIQTNVMNRPDVSGK